MGNQSNHGEIAKLEIAIEKSLKKIGSMREADLCHYIPVGAKNEHGVGGYMHHFTYGKLKGESPDELQTLLEQHIIQRDTPQKVAPKPRIRGPKRKKEQLFSRHDLERILQMARMAGDKEMVRKITAQQEDLKSVKKKLIASIRENAIESDLWNTYIELVTSQEALEKACSH